MSDVLDGIAAYKRAEIAAAKARVSPAEIQRQASRADPPRGFVAAIRRELTAGRPALIAEIKKASPSKGLIREDFDPPKLARAGMPALPASSTAPTTSVPCVLGSWRSTTVGVPAGFARLERAVRANL